jgi:hypothetical protein
MILRPLDDAGYFHARADEEHAAAGLATSAAARGRHIEMEAIYRFREMIMREMMMRSSPSACGPKQGLACDQVRRTAL